MKCAVLLNRSPPPLRTHFLLICGTSPDFAGMTSAMESYVIAGRTWATGGIASGASASGAAPMEVDAIMGDAKAKRKNNGKAKNSKKTRAIPSGTPRGRAAAARRARAPGRPRRSTVTATIAAPGAASSRKKGTVAWLDAEGSALNGLRDAARLFLQHLRRVLIIELGFESTPPQQTVFLRRRDRLFVTVHVDALLSAGPSETAPSFVMWLRRCFTVKFSDPIVSAPMSCVGARFWRQDGGFVEDAAEGYIEGILEDTGLLGAKSVNMPIIGRDDVESESPTLDAVEGRSTW